MTETLTSVRRRDKIVSVDDLARIRDEFRSQRIVHCHGAFDLVHIGHLIHFEEAKSLWRPPRDRHRLPATSTSRRNGR